MTPEAIIAAELDADLASKLREQLRPEELDSFALLVQQFCARGIDYSGLGVGWFHPDARLEYRKARHASFTSPPSRKRQEQSRLDLAALAFRIVTSAEGGDECDDVQGAITRAFLAELGVPSSVSSSWVPTFQAVHKALQQELAMPLRALSEARRYVTFSGAPLPREAVQKATTEVIRSVVEGRFKAWRYTNPVGQRQLEGLSEEQAALWQNSTISEFPVDSGEKLLVHDGRPEYDELDFFWATKIGGPSHGFDYETQCLLPLLCNARHKVCLVEDPAWPHNPAGRAHFRLLWTAKGEPRLWLEGVHGDFSALRGAGRSLQTSEWRQAVLMHAVAKAEAMGVPLSIDRGFGSMLETLDVAGEIHEDHKERLILRPSNGVVEASDYLSSKHDWLQQSEELIGPFCRTLFIPEPVKPSSPTCRPAAGCMPEVQAAPTGPGACAGTPPDSSEKSENVEAGAAEDDRASESILAKAEQACKEPADAKHVVKRTKVLQEDLSPPDSG